LDGSQYVDFVGFNNAAIHDHLLKHEVCFLQMEHDIQLTLDTPTPPPLTSCCSQPELEHCLGKLAFQSKTHFLGMI
jgi:hypothetical protein